MSEWWWWSVQGANPFVDFSTVWIEPLIQHAVDFSHRIEPDVLYTLAYLACMGSAYLFHSPFRAHSTAAMDTYGRVTKVFQTWSTIVYFCFHLGPQLLHEKRQEISGVRTKDTVPILFFPLFIVFTAWFGLLHKMKRRWGLGLTYGGRFSVIALNSLVLAALGTVHYAYCYTLRENASHHVWCTVLHYLMLSSASTHPFECVAKLLTLSALFIIADYHYKKWMGFDPARGILWAELFELNRGMRQEVLTAKKNGEEDRRDWRELVAPPRVYAPAAHSARLTAEQAAVAAASGTPAPVRMRDAVSNLSVMESPTRSMAQEVATHTLPTPRILYHECPPDVNLDLLESSYDADDVELRRICGGGASGVPQWKPNRLSSNSVADAPLLTHGPAAGVMGSAAHTAEPFDTTATTLMSFRTPQLFVKEAEKAQHPVNRPGMVPWWSTFVLFTAWQTLAGATLRFLAFDVRTIQGYTTPKIFHLHFFSSLRETLRSASEEFGRTTATPLCDECHPSLRPPGLRNLDSTERRIASSAATATPRCDEVNTVRRDDSGVRKRSAPASTAAPCPANPDVWFDWIADVGDGFNPTYAMARLLAQPMLRLPLRETRKAKRWRRFAHGLGKAARLGSFDALPVIESGSLSAPTTPKARKGGIAENGAASLNLSRAASVSTTSHPDVVTTDTESTAARTALWERPPKTSGVAAAARGSITRPKPGVKEDRTVTETPTTESLSSSSSVHPRRTPRRRTASEGTQSAKAAESRALLNAEKDGFVTLPRGSFVLVGGDLAYPSPSDETYTMRLFEPYHDAMSGNVRLQSVFHAEQQRVVVADARDVDVAHVHLLDAETVSGMATGRTAQRTGRATAEEALRSVPLLFAIPGNHDWFDGLTTYRKYILERTWIGGWLMPQRSSFFVLRLPQNWFILCGDTGNMQDIDVAQRNYFLDVIEKYMDAESCVVLAAHEPGWLYDAMEGDEKARQPELNRVADALGTRLRLRLAGDIHHYSRHTPRNASSEAPTLVVSGGGGAFLHGARDDVIISQGTKYARACAFPERNTFMNMASRLWGFRVINWKFDLIVGFLCFVLLLSVLPLPMHMDLNGRGTTGGGRRKMRVAQVFSLWVGYTTEIMSHVLTRGVISLLPLLFFWMCFSFAGADRHAPLLWRLCYGGVWAFAVLLCCSGAMAFLHVQLLYLMNHGLLQSAGGHWGTELENQATFMAKAVADYLRRITGGGSSWVSRRVSRGYDIVQAIIPMEWLRVLLRCFDPFESLVFLSMTVSGGKVAHFSSTASRLQVLLYYVYVLFFYWVLITPIVSVLIGTFLLFSVTTFDYMYNATYSAFQMEEYKHFLRFRLDAATRELHVYVVAVQEPSKVHQLDRAYLRSLTGPGLEEHRPPHLKQHPSRWGPVPSDARRKRSMTEVLEHFTVYPHCIPQRAKPPVEYE
ncbi:hypothetical protein LSCM1_06382 [Leishmania martiniquensis]|uniref:Metallo-dependent phosphatase-like domain-containing protein n=1 Tax=Leishmania martiniquensis TaxID=1580590 RepID=A0A836KVT5_9TRYP|nr:hypothetical protein LSCM1_06382 [Leishmania martiniquensis]